MKSSLVSCIVPVFNGERYLAEALESILKQSCRPLEIIVVDDGSSDSTAAVVRRYGDRVRYLWQNNSGPATARNLGLSAVQGDFVAFLDADDLWHAEKLARQMARFGARPELDVCVAHVQNFWIPELREEEERLRDNRVSKPLPGYSTVTLLARRSLFEAVGPFNAALRHGDSTDWFLRAAEHGAVIELLPDVLSYRRLHQTNRSRLLASNSRDEFLKIVKAVIDRRRVKNDGQVDDSKTSIVKKGV
jgi:glycosyltransferase involved in cell wall biosynthesis